MAKTPNPFVTYTFKDESEEPAAARFLTKSTATGGQITALQTAVAAMSTMRLSTYTKGEDGLISSLPGTGRREMKYLIRCHDVSNMQRFSFIVPGVREDTVTIEGTDFVDLTNDTEAAALVAAIEAALVTPWYDNLVAVDSIEITRGKK